MLSFEEWFYTIRKEEGRIWRKRRNWIAKDVLNVLNQEIGLITIYISRDL